MGGLAVPVSGIDRSAGKHPDAGHEPRLRVPLDEEQLEAPLGVLSPSPEEDYGRGRPRDGGRFALLSKRAASRLRQIAHLLLHEPGSTRSERTR
jgi:hypothetical protein